MRRKKRGFVRAVMAFCIAGSVIFAIPREVKAEKKELLGWNGVTVYGNKHYK